MRIVIFWFTVLFGKFVAKDDFGNKYYTSRFAIKGKKKRWVLYHQDPEPSKIPPVWNMWLRQIVENPVNEFKSYSWRGRYLPNLTGTIFSFKPKHSDKLSNKYHPWKENK